MFSRRTVISGTLILPAVLFGVAPPAGADIGITTQNVRVTLPPAQARHDVRQAAARGSVLFAQEMGRRGAGRFRPAGWGSAQAAGPFRGNCATFYNRHVWRLRSWRAVRLLDENLPAHPPQGHIWALVTVLTGAETLAGVCVHMPTKRAGDGVYAPALRRLRALLARLSSRYPRVVVGGDWNRDYSRRPALAGFRAARPPAPTHSPGVRIDYIYAHRPAHIARVRVIGRTYSDHNGVRVWVRNR